MTDGTGDVLGLRVGRFDGSTCLPLAPRPWRPIWAFQICVSEKAGRDLNSHTGQAGFFNQGKDKISPYSKVTSGSLH